MEFTRRAILAGTGALALASPHITLAQGLPPTRARISGAKTSPSIIAYKRAIDAMLKLDPMDGRNWFRQALIHVLDCPHGNWWFLPWHRGYLSSFERICGELSGDANFRLPYWDWTENASVPLIFYDEELDSGGVRFTEGYEKFRQSAENVLADLLKGYTSDQKAQFNMRYDSVEDVLATVDTHIQWASGARRPTKEAPALSSTAQAAVAPATIDRILDTKEFRIFASGSSRNHHDRGVSGVLESQPHDNVHGATGGFMGAFMSPIDPLFWLHHANLDRLWHVWETKQKKLGSPSLPDGDDLTSFHGEPFLFFHKPDGSPANLSCKDCTDIEKLGYAYESGSGEDILTVSIPISETFSFQEFSSTTVSKNLRSGFETSIAVTGLADALKGAAKDEGPELFARISLAPPSNPIDTLLRVYINCPYLSKYTPVDDPHYAGSVSFFSALKHAGHHGANHAGTLDVTVPLGQALRALDQQGKIPQSAIKVQLITDTLGGSEVNDGLLKSVVIEAV